jgi:DNA-binding GntR family transcriptional regulator
MAAPFGRRVGQSTADGGTAGKDFIYVITNRRKPALLNRANYAAQIYRQLRHELMAGQYEPGQKLKLRDIADRAGVSVTPVREALARLVSDQALVQIDHRSVCVPVMDLDRFDELRDLRLDLEGKAAAQAAARADAAAIDALAAIHARLLAARAADGRPDILLENERFHMALCRTAQMPVLAHLVETLWLQCGPLMHGMTRWPVVQPPRHPHVAVIAALRAGDGPGAAAAIREDIMMSTDALRRYLTSHAERPAWARQALGLKLPAPVG